jgi:hypothetical protein
MPARSHGASKHRLYHVWQGMLQRCYNKNCKGYPEWGGRGITVCDAWRKDIWVFIAWAEKKEYRPGLTLDRRDNDGNYTPRNCRFTTFAVQAANRRKARSHVLTLKGLAAVQAGVAEANRRRVWTKEQRAAARKLLVKYGKATRFGAQQGNGRRA